MIDHITLTAGAHSAEVRAGDRVLTKNGLAALVTGVDVDHGLVRIVTVSDRAYWCRLDGEPMSAIRRGLPEDFSAIDIAALAAQQAKPSADTAEIAALVARWRLAAKIGHENAAKEWGSADKVNHQSAAFANERCANELEAALTHAGLLGEETT